MISWLASSPKSEIIWKMNDHDGSESSALNPLTTVIGIFLPPAGLYHKIDIYNCF